MTDPSLLAVGFAAFGLILGVYAGMAILVTLLGHRTRY